MSAYEYTYIPTHTSIPMNLLAVDLYDKGVNHVKEGNIEEAFSAFRQVLAMEPNSAPAYNGLGICFHFMGRKQDAQSAYQHAARLDPRFASMQQRTLMDRLATLYRHKFLHPSMVQEMPPLEDDDDDFDD
jgi:Flp pilus assembly protein TadD